MYSTWGTINTNQDHKERIAVDVLNLGNNQYKSGSQGMHSSIWGAVDVLNLVEQSTQISTEDWCQLEPIIYCHFK